MDTGFKIVLLMFWFRLNFVMKMEYGTYLKLQIIKGYIPMMETCISKMMEVEDLMKEGIWGLTNNL